jgi:NMD protein affecting ribosome stability and mRNA decay
MNKREFAVPRVGSKALIRTLNRRGVRDDKSPQDVRKTPVLHEPTVCARCGAVFLRKTWRHNHALTDEQIEQGQWGFCPACQQLARQEGQGRVIVRGAGALRNKEAIRKRVENVAARAGKTQPERRLVSIDANDGELELLTTSQKLAHRLAHELKKAFGGKVTYAWSDDGSLFATWDSDAAKSSGRWKMG